MSGRWAQTDADRASTDRCLRDPDLAQPVEQFHLLPFRPGAGRSVSSARRPRGPRPGLRIPHDEARLATCRRKPHSVCRTGSTLSTSVLNNSFQREFLSPVRSDQVTEGSAGFYAQKRCIQPIGPDPRLAGRRLRNVRQFLDQPNSGQAAAFLGSPKASLVFGPFANTEFYADIGQGFHSNDARGTTITQDPADLALARRSPPLSCADPGRRIGIRTRAIEGLNSSVALFFLDAASEILFVGDAGTTASRPRPSRRSASK